MEPFARIAGRVVPGARLVRAWALEGGVSAQVHALQLALPDGSERTVVVRRHEALAWKPLPPRVTAEEFALLQAVRAAGLPVPRPLLLDESSHVLPSPYYVMAFVEGSTDVAEEDVPEALRCMAAMLARIHDTPVAGLSLPPREDPIRGTIPLLPESPDGARVRAALERRTWRERPVGLCHGDFWPGNLIWRAGTIAAVLDWEDAALGDPLSDLAGARLEVLIKWGPTAMESFTAEYLARRPQDVADLAVWELFVGHAAAASMPSWGLDEAVEQQMGTQVAAFLAEATRRLLADRRA